jgi:hypothetical protein
VRCCVCGCWRRSCSGAPRGDMGTRGSSAVSDQPPSKRRAHNKQARCGALPRRHTNTSAPAWRRLAPACLGLLAGSGCRNSPPCRMSVLPSTSTASGSVANSRRMSRNSRCIVTDTPTCVRGCRRQHWQPCQRPAAAAGSANRAVGAHTPPTHAPLPGCCRTWLSALHRSHTAAR